jgi:hypothetical protein
MIFTQAVVAASLAFLVVAHPGESHAQKRAEARARSNYLASLEKTDLAHCVGAPATQNVIRRTVQRRKEIAAQLTKRAIEDGDTELEKRQLWGPLNQLADGLNGWNRVLQKSHKSKLDVSQSSFPNADWVLLGQNKSTVLSPMVTEGPYCKSINPSSPKVIFD